MDSDRSRRIQIPIGVDDSETRSTNRKENILIDLLDSNSNIMIYYLNSILGTKSAKYLLQNKVTIQSGKRPVRESLTYQIGGIDHSVFILDYGT